MAQSDSQGQAKQQLMTTPDLDQFWQHIERQFPFAGCRRRLQQKFGGDLVETLEKTGILSYRAIADRYPCDRRAGDECPREIIQQSNGTYRAQCANRPAECISIDLDAADVEILCTEPREFCGAITAPLRIRLIKDIDTALNRCFRVGAFIPEPGEKYPVYFLTRSRASDYDEGLEALRSRHEGAPIAVLVPTEEVLGDEAIRERQARGVTVLALSNILMHTEGCLAPTKDPRELFHPLGSRGLSLAGQICAIAYCRQKSGSHTTKELTKAEYDQFIADHGKYDFFADQLMGVVVKPGEQETGESSGPPTATAFQMIRSAIESHGYFDPSSGEFSKRNDPAQTFRRARARFDYKGDDGQWTFFHTVPDRSSPMYRFAPRQDVSYAFVFTQNTR